MRRRAHRPDTSAEGVLAIDRGSPSLLARMTEPATPGKLRMSVVNAPRRNVLGFSRGLVQVMGVLVASAVLAARATGSPRAVLTCPKVANSSASYDFTAAMSAAKKLGPALYHGDRGKIVELALLEPQRPELPGRAHWRAIAQKRCGRTVAALSWLVVSIFPDSKVAVPSTGVFFMANTSSGWDAWYRYR